MAVACVLIAAKLEYSGTNTKSIIQNARNDLEYKSITNFEFEILKELEFEVNKPTLLDF